MPVQNIKHSKGEFDTYYKEHLRAWLENANDFTRADSLTFVYEQIYRMARKSEIDEATMQDVTNKYALAMLDLSFLIKRDMPIELPRAEALLKKVLSMVSPRKAPIANYRLAFVAYMRMNYAEAIQLADLSLKEKQEFFNLEEYQIKNATNLKKKCALKILLDTPNTNEKAGNDPETQSLFQELLRTNDVGEKPIIRKVWKNGQITDERELFSSEYNQIIDNFQKENDQLFFDLYDPTPNLKYQNTAWLTGKQVETFRVLLNIRDDYFQVIKGNTGNQNIRRLRENLRKLNGLEDRFSIINPADGAPYIKTDLTINIFERALL